MIQMAFAGCLWGFDGWTHQAGPRGHAALLEPRRRHPRAGDRMPHYWKSLKTRDPC